MFSIYDALGDVVVRSTEPRLGAIKLAWWRERLEELDQGGAPPAEPRLRAVAAELLPRGIRGSEMADLEAGWAAWLEQGPDHGAYFPEVGVHLFRLGARLLGVETDDPMLATAGRLFASVEVARRGLLEQGKSWPSPMRAPRRLRPLTMLAALSARDLKRGGAPFEPEGTPARAWTLLRHRLTGRI